MTRDSLGPWLAWIAHAPPLAGCAKFEVSYQLAANGRLRGLFHIRPLQDSNLFLEICLYRDQEVERSGADVAPRLDVGQALA